MNILSVTEFANSLNDDKGTGIDTNRTKSRFYWDKGQYERTFLHSSSNLPEMPINEGVSSFSWFTRACAKKIDDTIQCTCCCTNKHLDKPGDKDISGATDFLESVIYENKMMIYRNSGQNSLVRIKSRALNEEGVLEYSIEFSDGQIGSTTREHLNRPENPTITDLPRTTVEYRSTAEMLLEEELRKIANPVQLSPLQQEFLAMRRRLYHLPFAVMFRLAHFGILPKNYLLLKDKPPPRVSCMFPRTDKKQL